MSEPDRNPDDFREAGTGSDSMNSSSDRPCYDFEDLAKGSAEIEIVLSSVYVLKKTKSGKLILQK